MIYEPEMSHIYYYQSWGRRKKPQISIPTIGACQFENKFQISIPQYIRSSTEMGFSSTLSTYYGKP